jgi:hypothetical protein
VASRPGEGRSYVAPDRLRLYQWALAGDWTVSAADAATVVVRVVGTSGDPPPRDQCVTVTGTFQSGGEGLPELAATSLAEIRAPNVPYE